MIPGPDFDTLVPNTFSIQERAVAAAAVGEVEDAAVEIETRVPPADLGIQESDLGLTGPAEDGRLTLADLERNPAIPSDGAPGRVVDAERQIHSLGLSGGERRGRPQSSGDDAEGDEAAENFERADAHERCKVHCSLCTRNWVFPNATTSP